jgi:hypothetical protein
VVGHGVLVGVSIFGKEQQRGRAKQPERRRDPLGPTKELGQELEGLDDGAQEDEAKILEKGLRNFLAEEGEEEEDESSLGRRRLFT